MDSREIGNGGAETRYLASHAIRAAPKIGQATMRAIPKGYGVKDSCPAMDPANPNPRIPPIIISIILVVIAAFLSPLALAERRPRRRVSDSAPPLPFGPTANGGRQRARVGVIRV